MSIWLLLLYAVAMTTLVLGGSTSPAFYHTIAAVSLAGFVAAVFRSGVRKPVV